MQAFLEYLEEHDEARAVELREKRKSIARLGGLALAAKHDPMKYTSKARATFMSRFVDDREKTEYFKELARKSAQARRKNKRK